MPAGGWALTEQTIEPLPPVIEGTVLLSVSVFQRNGTEYEALAKAKPIAILGGSILVYRGRFEVPLAAALSYRERGRQYRRWKRFDEAIADGRKAVELAPDDPRPHLFLGITLSRSGKNDEARQELEATVRLAQSNLDQFRDLQESAQEELQHLP
jgi:tetratricopeptide (TPR) repeat protein